MEHAADIRHSKINIFIEFLVWFYYFIFADSYFFENVFILHILDAISPSVTSLNIFSPQINGDLMPEERWGHVSVFYQGKLIVFSGYNSGDGFLSTNVIWRYDKNISMWTKHTAKGR